MTVVDKAMSTTYHMDIGSDSSERPFLEAATLKIIHTAVR